MTVDAATPSEKPKRKGKSLREIFNHFAADTAQRFPELAGRIVFAEFNERRVYGHEQVDAQKTKVTPESVIPFIQNHEITREIEESPEASSCALYDPRAKINIIFMNENVPQAERDDLKEETEMHMHFVLDHELAHCAVRNGRIVGSDNGRPTPYDVMVGETVADAYATLRHWQRYGTQSTFADQYVDPAARAFYFIAYGDKSHFTSFALDELIRLRETIDVNALSPAQTAELARRFAMEHMPPKPVMEELEVAFSEIRGAFRRNQVEQGVRLLIAKALDPQSSYYTYRMGSLWLGRCLETGKLPDGTVIRLPAEELANARQRLKLREMQYDKEKILFGMPRKSTVAAPKSNLPPAALRGPMAA